MDLAVALGIAAIAVAIIVPLGVEWLKRRRLEIRPSPFRASGPLSWTFAAVRVYNKPLPRFMRRLLVRQPAEGCEATVEFRRLGDRALAIPTIAARWSSRPEPIRSQLVGTASAASVVSAFDPALVPETRRLDVAAGGNGEELAVAILKSNGAAYAWGAESYAWPGWEAPSWKLPRGQYEVRVLVEAAGVRASRRFMLDNTTPDFARFELSPLPDKR